MAYFYLSDGVTTLDLDDTVNELTIGGIKRDFSIDDFVGADGGILTGTGKIGERKFTISRKERIEGGDASAWNSRRLDYLKWFMKNRYTDIYLYIVSGEGTLTVRTKVYCTDIGSEKYSNIRTSDNRGITLISPSGVFEKTTTTDYSDTALSGYGTFTFSPSIQSIIDTPAIYTITANATLNSFKLWIAESIGFSIAGPFASSDVIVYNNLTNVFTINGTQYDIANYLTSGGRFSIPGETDTLYYYFSASADLDISIYERYI